MRIINCVLILAVVVPSAMAAPLQIPFRWTPGQIEIQVSIDGRAPIWFILDSGSDFSMLDAQVAKSINLGTKRVSARIGPITLEQLELRPWNLDHFRRQKREIRGVIGHELFDRYVVTVDYEKHVLILNEPRSFRPSSAARAVPITFSGHLPVIKTTLTIAGKRIPATLMVDTGASQAVILRYPFATAHGLLARGSAATTFEVVAGRRSFAKVSIDELRLDRWTFTAPSAEAYATPAGAGGGTDTDGLLGNDILQHFRVTFDYSRKRMLFEGGLEGKK
jgi:aspartyl protease